MGNPTLGYGYPVARLSKPGLLVHRPNASLRRSELFDGYGTTTTSTGHMSSTSAHEAMPPVAMPSMVIEPTWLVFVASANTRANTSKPISFDGRPRLEVSDGGQAGSGERDGVEFVAGVDDGVVAEVGRRVEHEGVVPSAESRDTECVADERVVAGSTDQRVIATGR